jgi:hypothetical protein
LQSESYAAALPRFVGKVVEVANTRLFVNVPNVAVAVVGAEIFNEQLRAGEEQAPVQPEKKRFAPLVIVARRAMAPPASTRIEQLVPQLIPAGVEVTVPPPTTETVSRYWPFAAATNVTEPPGEALIVRLALLAPPADGVTATDNEHVPPAGRTPVQPFVRTINSAGLAFVSIRVPEGDPPTLLMVHVATVDVTPTSTFPKSLTAAPEREGGAGTVPPAPVAVPPVPVAVPPVAVVMPPVPPVIPPDAPPPPPVAAPPPTETAMPPEA